MNAYEPSEPVAVPLEGWPRRDHFHFYRQFLEPFFSVTVPVDCTQLITQCRSNAVSPTLPLWHGVLKAANQIDAFALRIKDGAPVRYPVIHLSPTVLRPDETFAISFLPYLERYEDFAREALPRLEQAKLSQGLPMDLETRRQDLIHFSTLPWFRFTSLSHARPLQGDDSEPKISLGKFSAEGDRYSIPVSVTVHHGLMDALHVARLLDRLAELYSEPW